MKRIVVVTLLGVLSFGTMTEVTADGVSGGTSASDPPWANYPVHQTAEGDDRITRIHCRKTGNTRTYFDHLGQQLTQEEYECWEGAWNAFTMEYMPQYEVYHGKAWGKAHKYEPATAEAHYCPEDILH